MARDPDPERHNPRAPRAPGSGTPSAPSHLELDEAAELAHEVESDLEELGDPEAGPALPASTISAQAAAPLRDRLGVAVESDTPPRSATREILRLAWPVMLTQVLVSAAGLIDRAMVGRLGGDDGAAIPLAAAGFATQFFFLIQSALFAVSLACVALMARAIGGGDPARARSALAASLQVSVVVTLALATIMLVGARWMLGMLGAQPIVVEAALPYLQLVVGSSLMLAITLVLDGALKANRNTRTPMLIALVVTAVKLGANWLLIFGNGGFPQLELVGAGLATVLSQIVGLVLFGVVLLRAPRDGPVYVGRRDWRAARELRPDVVRVAAPGIAERIVMNLAMLSYFWVIANHYGTVNVAAYTVGVALLSFSWIPGTGYAQACATLVGQSLGANRPELATRIGWRSTGLAVATAIPLGIFFGLARFPLARLFTNDEAVIAALGPFMLALAVAQPLLQLHFTLGGAHRGAGDTWTPLVAATIGNWAFRVPLAVAAAVYFEADIVWVWYAIIADHFARAIIMVISYQRGRWRNRLAGSG